MAQTVYMDFPNQFELYMVPEMWAYGPPPALQGQPGMVTSMPPLMVPPPPMPMPSQQGLPPQIPPSMFPPILPPMHSQMLPPMLPPMPPQMPFGPLPVMVLQGQQGMVPPMPTEVPGAGPLLVINEQNAQAYLPLEHRIFVGNLPRNMGEANVRDALAEIFYPIGFCFIAPQRESHFPHAFVQFVFPGCAPRALLLHRRAQVNGRWLRIEAATGPRQQQYQNGPDVVTVPRLLQPQAAMNTPPSTSSSSENEVEKDKRTRKHSYSV